MSLRQLLLCGLAVASAAPCIVPSRAASATGLSSFDAIEEPSVKFYPATGKFEPDAVVNIIDVGGGILRMYERFNNESWDGDRDTLNKDRQRAEVKGLGPHQRHGETFEYTTTWRGSPRFRGSGGFCHLFQLKATDGDSGAPLVTLSIQRDVGTALVAATPVGEKFTARQFAWQPDAWQNARIRVKTSPTAEGELMVSIDGSEFLGRTGVELSRPGSTAYRPKWGLYRRAGVGLKMGDDYVEHKDITAYKIAPEAAPIDNAALEIAARERAQKESPAKALTWLQSRPAGAGRDFAIASIVALWAETQPTEAMAWAEQLPAGALRVDALGRVFTRWTDRDVSAAAAWMRRKAPAAELDSILWLYATDTTYRYVNRAIALDAASLITDPELRRQAFEHVVLIWARQEPDNARKFLDWTPSLTAEQKKTIADKIRSRRAAEVD